jgi:hypothetical protein
MRLAAITALYGVRHQPIHATNYWACKSRLQSQGIELWTVEGLYPEQTPRTSSSQTITFELESVLWHKERLLQLGIQQLPDVYDAVLWIDADVLFDLPDIRERIEHVLEQYPVCQPWSDAVYLSEAGRPMNGPIDLRDPNQPDFSAWALEVPRFLHRSMAAANFGRPADTSPARNHPGLAWAGRRIWIETVGLYQHNMGGAGDVTMCEGFWGNQTQQARDQYSDAQWRHVCDWVTWCWANIKGQVGYVPGTIRHLWHGSLRDRRYRERIAAVEQAGFDPWRHLVTMHGQPLRWAPTAPQQLIGWMAGYLGAA